jgi:hypothetical protein
LTDEALRRAYARFLASRATGSRIGCAAPEAIDALASADGDRAERLHLLDHVMGCALCRKEFDQLRALHRAARADRRVRGTRWLAAAAILLAVAATLLWKWQTHASERELRGRDRLSLLAPIGEVPGTPPLTFVWHAVPLAVTYRFELLDRDSLRYALTQTDTTLSLPDSVRLERGRTYGWWVTAEIPGEREVTSRVRRFIPQRQ